jgi:hypothetical protein
MSVDRRRATHSEPEVKARMPRRCQWTIAGRSPMPLTTRSTPQAAMIADR